MNNSEKPYAVVVGGGTGAPASIHALLDAGYAVDVVVAMADNGGSTGRLRTQVDITPAGDVRKCLVALASPECAALSEMLQCRPAYADEHAMGNLILATLEQQMGSFPAALHECEKMLHARGHVIPSTLCKAHLNALTADGTSIFGQREACHYGKRLGRVWLTAEDGGEARAYASAIQALEAADMIVLGPGSLFTSVMANIAVPGIPEAIQQSQASVVYVSNIADDQGETQGMTVTDQVHALEDHGLQGRINLVIADDGANAKNEPFPDITKRISLLPADEQALSDAGMKSITADFYNKEHPGWHEISVLAEVFKRMM